MIKKELTLCILSVCLFSCKDNKGTIAPFSVPEQGNIIAELNITENGDTVVSCDIEKVSYSFSLKIMGTSVFIVARNLENSICCLFSSTFLRNAPFN